jgi:hypothetical protein
MGKGLTVWHSEDFLRLLIERIVDNQNGEDQMQCDHYIYNLYICDLDELLPSTKKKDN